MARKHKAGIGRNRTINVVRNNKAITAKRFALKPKPLVSPKNKKNPLEG